MNGSVQGCFFYSCWWNGNRKKTASGRFILVICSDGDSSWNALEWIGAGMLFLFLLHNGLNFKWYQNLFRGKWSVYRAIYTLLNLTVLVSILLTGYSGIVMSRHVFAFLPDIGGMATARKLHLAGSYWSFVLMGIHLGMHWNGIVGKWKIEKPVWQMVGNLAAFAAAFYGALIFGRNNILGNMFLKNEFAMLDYEKAGVFVLLENLVMMLTWIFVGHYLMRGFREISKAVKKSMISLMMVLIMILCMSVTTPKAQQSVSWSTVSMGASQSEEIQPEETQLEKLNSEELKSEDMVLITAGTFEMGSPESEGWRSNDETLHSVTVSDFYISAYELTQKEYAAVMGDTPSSFSGDDLPVENVSWLDAVRYCNARSEQEGLTSVYTIKDEQVTWDRSADGYRLPTEAEWEYACRAGTNTPFNTQTSISAEEANYYGHYPYEIEENYFSQNNLTTKPGEYRETTVTVDSFAPNAWGLYNMHGNVSEWVWDYYGEYGEDSVIDPTGADSGTLKVYRGGGWNDFAKNMRSAYRATLEKDIGSFNIGIRLVRNADNLNTDVVGDISVDDQVDSEEERNGKVLIAFFSWSGNTRGVANEIQAQTGADIFEITLANPYSEDYNTVLEQSQRDQNIQARPEITDHIDNMEEYETILIGYPNWWASIPMPIASFLEEYDFSSKTIIPFCSHGGGRFGQSLTAIAKLAPDSVMGKGLSIHYSGGDSLSEDVTKWLLDNGILK